MELLDEIVYSSYKFNRDSFPWHKPEAWKAVFKNVDAMEERYQREANA